MFDNSQRREVVANYFKKQGQVISVPKNHTFTADELAGKILYIQKGYVKAYFLSSKKTVRFIFGAGDMIHLQLLVNKYRSDLHYNTISATRAYSVTVDKLTKDINTNYNLTSSLLFESLSQLEYRSERIENLAYNYASDKLIYRILYLAERFGVNKRDAIYINLPIKHRELGLSINMTRESVSREMKKLIDKKLIRYANNRITILDIDTFTQCLHETIRSDWESLHSLSQKAIIT